jgi:hypothetical protein
MPMAPRRGAAATALMRAVACGASRARLVVTGAAAQAGRPTRQLRPHGAARGMLGLQRLTVRDSRRGVRNRRLSGFPTNPNCAGGGLATRVYRTSLWDSINLSHTLQPSKPYSLPTLTASPSLTRSPLHHARERRIPWLLAIRCLAVFQYPAHSLIEFPTKWERSLWTTPDESSLSVFVPFPDASFVVVL